MKVKNYGFINWATEVNVRPLTLLVNTGDRSIPDLSQAQALCVRLQQQARDNPDLYKQPGSTS